MDTQRQLTYIADHQASLQRLIAEAGKEEDAPKATHRIKMFSELLRKAEAAKADLEETLARWIRVKPNHDHQTQHLQSPELRPPGTDAGVLSEALPASTETWALDSRARVWAVSPVVSGKGL